MTWRPPEAVAGMAAAPFDLTLGDTRLYVGVEGDPVSSRVDGHTFWIVADTGVMEAKLEAALRSLRNARKAAA